MGIPWLTYSLIFSCCSYLVESRHCVFITADGRERTIFCSAYEYCCGNGCCRPTFFKFYQFWYFWLSVILIMLLCSGGSWWYRYKYRNQLLSQHTPFTHIANANISQPRPNTGVLYCPSADRVYLGSAPKDPALYQYMKVGMPPPPPPPSYGVAAPAGNFSYQSSYPPPGAQQSSLAPAMPPPPPYGGPPPSYDCIVPPTAAVNAYPSYPIQSSGQPSSQTYPQPDHTNPQPTNPFTHGQDSYLRNRTNEPFSH